MGVNIEAHALQLRSQDRTEQDRQEDPTRPVKNVSLSLSQGFGFIHNNTFPFKRCSPGRRHPTIKSPHFVSLQVQPNRPHNRMHSAEPGTGTGGMEQEEPKAEL